MNNLLEEVSPDLDTPRIRRYVAFDLPTFDALQEAKRRLSRLHRLELSNAAVLRVMLLSHPWTAAQGTEL